MTDAAAVAATYFDAWKARDFGRLRSVLADDVDFAGPLGRVRGGDDCLRGLQGMAQIMTGLDVRRVFHDEPDVLTWFDLSTSVPVGTWAIIVGAVVLLLWIPLRQRPGLGTLWNVVVVGAVIDLVLAVVPPVHSLPVQVAVMASGVVLNGVATGMYIGAGLGPGPRDGLMTGFAARGHSLRVVRTCIEITVLAAGWLLGGTDGVGTVVYAACIGPLAHVFAPLLLRPGPRNPAREGTAEMAADT